MKSMLGRILYLAAAVCVASTALAQTPASTLLVLAKSDNTVAIVDPATSQVLARLPAAGPQSAGRCPASDYFPCAR